MKFTKDKEKVISHYTQLEYYINVVRLNNLTTFDKLQIKFYLKQVDQKTLNQKTYA